MTFFSVGVVCSYSSLGFFRARGSLSRTLLNPISCLQKSQQSQRLKRLHFVKDGNGLLPFLQELEKRASGVRDERTYVVSDHLSSCLRVVSQIAASHAQHPFPDWLRSFGSKV